MTSIRSRASRVPRRRLRHGVTDQCINCASGGKSASARAWRYGQVDSPSRKYESSVTVVQSQTVGQRLWLVHAQAIKSDLRPLQSTIKLFVWPGAGISIKTFGTKKNRRAGLCKGTSKVLPPITGDVCHFMLSSVSGCSILIDLLLLGYFCQSMNPLEIYDM